MKTVAAWLCVGAVMTLVATPATAQTASFGTSLSTLDGVDGAMGGAYVDVDFPAWKALRVAGSLSTARAWKALRVAGSLSTARAELTGFFYSIPLNRVYAGVGPRVRGGERVQAFAHILFGVVSVGTDARDVVNAGYGEQYGGGVDWFFSDSWGLRTALDYNKATHFNIAMSWRP